MKTPFTATGALPKTLLSKSQRTKLRHQHKGWYSLWSSAMWRHINKKPWRRKQRIPPKRWYLPGYTASHPEFHNLNTHNCGNDIFHRHDGILEVDDTDPLILTPVISWRWVVSSTLQPFYVLGIDSVANGGPQSSSGFFGVRKNFLGPASVKCADNLPEEEIILHGTIYRPSEDGNNCGKIKVMRISGQPFAVRITIDQYQSEESGTHVFQLFV